MVPFLLLFQLAGPLLSCGLVSCYVTLDSDSAVLTSILWKLEVNWCLCHGGGDGGRMGCPWESMWDLVSSQLCAVSGSKSAYNFHHALLNSGPLQ